MGESVTSFKPQGDHCHFSNINGTLYINPKPQGQMIHPQIPQLAIIGYSKGFSNLFTSEMRCQCLAHFLNGTFELPCVRAMEKEVMMREKHMKQYADRLYRRSCVGALQIWYNDQLCGDIRCESRRKKGFYAEQCGPTNYIGLKPDLCRSKQNLEAAALLF